MTGETVYDKRLIVDFNVDGPILDHAVKIGLMDKN